MPVSQQQQQQQQRAQRGPGVWGLAPMTYSHRVHPIYLPVHGHVHPSISQILGKAWCAETPEVRLRYKNKADRIKDALMERYPDYQYRPRKKSDFRRRSRALADGAAGSEGSSTPASSGHPTTHSLDSSQITLDIGGNTSTNTSMTTSGHGNGNGNGNTNTTTTNGMSM
ncbi:hypothetical protein QQS21_012763 [Conoideocrella luteorostrata]|uniref:HMG box domain-containing protein n=1 Tax=Conoideocrella luteorostrata TaxID=1105319 RepID=A0AAJ0FSE1_9HYPO|nr:hypothetical protein QQS21_012763 [Conoideocrella luteorostrata]